jgi:hypothetical protein
MAGTADSGPAMSGAGSKLDQAHEVFRRWLGQSYDLIALDAVLAVAAVEQLDGDPVWLMIVSGSGNTKTETINALAGVGAIIISTITGEAGLLSATPKKDRSKDATGGLLREVGQRGLLGMKDFTSVLAMNTDRRGEILAAFREIYDGHWDRRVGADGGHPLSWDGRLVVIGACTSAYDRAHAVIASMGPRFAVIRTDSETSTVRRDGGRQAIRNTRNRSEALMRADLAESVKGILGDINPELAAIDDEEEEALLCAADLVTLARTGVERDKRGEVVDADSPEMPTRFAKMLTQIVRGALSIGADHDHAMRIAIRVAADSVPPLRLRILGELLTHAGSTTSDVRKRVDKPRTTVDRTLQELHLLGLLTQQEGDAVYDTFGKDRRPWVYALAEEIDREALSTLWCLRTRNTQESGSLIDDLENGTSLGESLGISGVGGQASEQGKPPPPPPPESRRPCDAGDDEPPIPDLDTWFVARQRKGTA